MESTNTNKIESLEAELRNANDLLKLHSEVLPLATTETGLSLTQIYSKYVESSRKLRDEKEETARLNNYLTQIMQELEEKTPVLQKLRRDHDVFVRANQELQNKMEMIAEDSETLRVEAEESLKFSRVVERENKRLKVLTGDLGRQVKTLLQECEEARGGVASTSHVLSCDTGDEVSSSSQVRDQVFFFSLPSLLISFFVFYPILKFLFNISSLLPLLFLIIPIPYPVISCSLSLSLSSASLSLLFLSFCVLTLHRSSVVI